MWTFETLQTKESWDLADLPPQTTALIPDIDLRCLADEGEIDPGLALHLAYEALYEHPEPDTPAWLLAAITANPGTWISRLCRAKHDLPETYRSIAYCGLCAGGYANQRKRLRAAKLQKAVLPGFEEIGGAYHLHPPCSKRDLTWLRHQVYRLVGRGKIVKIREKRPDIRQPRGWDLMACLYPNEKGVEHHDQ